jgi:tRNA pseudouridine55 synthase
MQNTECRVPYREIAERLAKIEWNTMLNQFRGETEQIPPMYSAKKVAGKKLYELARKGVEIERKAVTVTISKLEITGELTENPELETCDLGLRVACSAGTYIRTLAEDIGRAVGVGAHLTELRRTRAGHFDISQSVTLDELEQRVDPTTALLPKEIAVEHLPSIILDATRVEKTKNGLSTRIHEAKFADNDAIRMLDEMQNLIAVGFYDATENSVRPKIVLV